MDAFRWGSSKGHRPDPTISSVPIAATDPVDHVAGRVTDADITSRVDRNAADIAQEPVGDFIADDAWKSKQRDEPAGNHESQDLGTSPPPTAMSTEEHPSGPPPRRFQ